MTNVEYCCQRFNQQGGTIHQFAEKLNFTTEELVNMPQRMLTTVINNYLLNSIPVKIKALKKGQELLIVPDGIRGMISGVKYVSIDKTYKTTLHYEDNSTETAQLKKDNINDETNFFSFVSAVQAKR